MSDSGMDRYPTPPSFEPPPPLPQLAPGPPYRLRLWHFFLWTFASALVAAVTRRPDYMRELVESNERSYLILNATYCLIACPLVAAGLWFLGFALPYRLYAGHWLHNSLGSQPGHWLLLIGGMETSAGLVSYCPSSWRGPDNREAMAVTWGIAYLVGMILAFHAWNRCTKDKTISAPWSALFWTGAVVRMVCCFGNPWFLPLMLLGGRLAMLRGTPVESAEFMKAVSTIAIVLLSASVVADLRGKSRRDIFHWIGVVVTLAVFLYPILWCLLLPLEI